MTVTSLSLEATSISPQRCRHCYASVLTYVLYRFCCWRRRSLRPSAAVLLTAVLCHYNSSRRPLSPSYLRLLCHPPMSPPLLSPARGRCSVNGVLSPAQIDTLSIKPRLFDNFLPPFIRLFRSAYPLYLSYSSYFSFLFLFFIGSDVSV